MTLPTECSGFSDSDCEDGLYCYQRNEYESVPGCSGGSLANSSTLLCLCTVNTVECGADSSMCSSFAGSDFCVKEKKKDHDSETDDDRSKIRDKGSDYCTSKHPCSECEGDCDS